MIDVSKRYEEGGMAVSDELARLAELKEKGALSNDEFQKAKAKVLSSHVASAFVRHEPAKSGMSWAGKTLITVGVLVAVFFGIGIVASNSPEGKAKAKDRAAIELCWSDYERKDLTSDAKRFVANTCYRMTGDFKNKYGVSP